MIEKHDMVAVHASIGNEKRSVQPHKVETQVWLAQSVSGTSLLPTGPVRRTGLVKEQYAMHLKIRKDSSLLRWIV